LLEIVRDDPGFLKRFQAEVYLRHWHLISFQSSYFTHWFYLKYLIFSIWMLQNGNQN
jgi:hypothetical protein